MDLNPSTIINHYRELRLTAQRKLRELDKANNKVKRYERKICAAIKLDKIEVKDLATIDKFLTISLLVHCGLCPSTQEAIKRVKKLLINGDNYAS